MTSVRLSKTSDSPRCVLQARDRQLLADLFLHRVMSRDQILDLGYFHTVPRCNNRLRKLLVAGLVRRRTSVARGSASQALYQVGKAAVPHICLSLDLGADEVTRIVVQGTANLALEHTLGLVDLRIVLGRVAHDEGLQDYKWVPEALCRHEYSVRNAGTWTQHILKPDALVHWRTHVRQKFNFVELDLGHVSQGAFRRKIESYRRYLCFGVFSETYGEDLFDVLIITTGHRRLENLRSLVGKSSSPRFRFATWTDVTKPGTGSPVWLDNGGGISSLGGKS